MCTLTRGMCWGVRFAGAHLSAAGLREWAVRYQLSDADDARVCAWAADAVAAYGPAPLVGPARTGVRFDDALPSPYKRIAHGDRCRAYLGLLHFMHRLSEEDAAALEDRRRALWAEPMVRGSRRPLTWCR
jgi:hypothetical protein